MNESAARSTQICADAKKIQELNFELLSFISEQLLRHAERSKSRSEMGSERARSKNIGRTLAPPARMLARKRVLRVRSRSMAQAFRLHPSPERPI